MRLGTYYPRGSEPSDPRLGRYVSDDWEHVDKYPLSSAQAEAMPPTPVAIGVNFYSKFFEPERDSQGHWWIGRDVNNLGTIEGGHCMALKQRYASDLASWWDYYNQGQSSRCVQFGCSRVMTLKNRKQYEIRDGRTNNVGWWFYYEAQRNDEWAGGEYPGASPQYGGTSVNAGLKIARNEGLIRKDAHTPDLNEGISAYRWITSIDDCLSVLGYQELDYVDMINSWGRDYPHLTRIPVDTLERLWKEDGEFGVITDR